MNFSFNLVFNKLQLKEKPLLSCLLAKACGLGGLVTKQCKAVPIIAFILAPISPVLANPVPIIFAACFILLFIYFFIVFVTLINGFNNNFNLNLIFF